VSQRQMLAAAGARLLRPKLAASFAEWRQGWDAAPLLGFEASKKDIDELFNSWDSDGGGSLDFKELRRILSAPTPAPAAAAAKAAAKLKAKGGEE